MLQKELEFKFNPHRIYFPPSTALGFGDGTINKTETVLFSENLYSHGGFPTIIDKQKVNT